MSRVKSTARKSTTRPSNVQTNVLRSSYISKMSTPVQSEQDSGLSSSTTGSPPSTVKAKSPASSSNFSSQSSLSTTSTSFTPQASPESSQLDMPQPQPSSSTVPSSPEPTETPQPDIRQASPCQGTTSAGAHFLAKANTKIKKTLTRQERRQARAVLTEQRDNVRGQSQFGVGRGKGGVRRIRRAIERQQEQEEEASRRRLSRQERVAREEEERQQDLMFQQINSLYYRELGEYFPRIPFLRLVKQIASNLRENMRFQVRAMDALREAAADYLICKFEKCACAVAHAKRVTLLPRDLHLINRLDRMSGLP